MFYTISKKICTGIFLVRKEVNNVNSMHKKDENDPDAGSLVKSAQGEFQGYLLGLERAKAILDDLPNNIIGLHCGSRNRTAAGKTPRKE